MSKGQGQEGACSVRTVGRPFIVSGGLVSMKDRRGGPRLCLRTVGSQRQILSRGVTCSYLHSKKHALATEKEAWKGARCECGAVPAMQVVAQAVRYGLRGREGPRMPSTLPGFLRQGRAQRPSGFRAQHKAHFFRFHRSLPKREKTV